MEKGNYSIHIYISTYYRFGDKNSSHLFHILSAVYSCSFRTIAGNVEDANVEEDDLAQYDDEGSDQVMDVFGGKTKVRRTLETNNIQRRSGRC